MTPEAALYSFFSSFDIPAFAATATPSDVEFPYLTYDLVIGEWNSGEVNIPVNVWYRTSGEAQPNAKVREIAQAIGYSGVNIPCDGGVLWIKKGSPWAQTVRVEGEDDLIKRRYINVNVEYNITP